MAILKFFMNEEKGKNEMLVKLFLHEGETKNDSTFKWGQYALHLAVQLNFNDVQFNPFAVDQGCAIQFLSHKIIKDNNLNADGYELEDDEEDFYDYDEEDEYEEDDDFFDDNDVDFSVFSDAFEARNTYEALEALESDSRYVNIMLDQHDAVKIVGGLLTMTATSGTAIHEALKESAKRSVLKS